MLNIIENNKIKNSELVSCSFYTGGSMSGGFDSIDIRKVDDKNAQIIVKHADTHADRAVSKIYTASIDILKDIKQKIIDDNFVSLSKKPKSPFEVMDGDTSTFSATFNPFDSLSVSSYLQLGKNGFDIFYGMKNYLLSLAKGEPTIEIEPHQLSIPISPYTILYNIDNNVLEEDVLKLAGIHHIKKDDTSIYYEIDSIDISNLNKVKELENGYILYDDKNKRIVLNYDLLDEYKDYYYLGQLEFMSDSTIELLKNTVEADYQLYLYK